MLTLDLRARLDRLVPGTTERLEVVGGSWGQTVFRAVRSGADLAVKTGPTSIAGQSRIEGRMLTALGDAGLPVPQIAAIEDDLLAMEWIEPDPQGLRPVHQRKAGEFLARLHSHRGENFGYPENTPIGPLMQDNGPLTTWCAFVRERRLAPLAAHAIDLGAISPGLGRRLDAFAGRLERYLSEPAFPALLHGDLWFGNILPRPGGLLAFIDPAAYFGDPEADLAYATMHASLGQPFFEAYSAHIPVDADFFRIRRDLNLLVPLLQHAILCGSVYAHRIDRILQRVGH